MSAHCWYDMQPSKCTNLTLTFDFWRWNLITSYGRFTPTTLVESRRRRWCELAISPPFDECMHKFSFPILAPIQDAQTGGQTDKTRNVANRMITAWKAQLLATYRVSGKVSIHHVDIYGGIVILQIYCQVSNKQLKVGQRSLTSIHQSIFESINQTNTHLQMSLMN